MSVWVQVVIDGKRFGQPFEIQPIPTNINELKKAVKEISKLDASINTILVYPPPTEIPIQFNAVACNAWDEVPDTDPLPGNNAPRPLIVVAPDSQREGKSRFLCLFLVAWTLHALFVPR